MSHDFSQENTNFPSIPEDILFPDELCRYLKGELQTFARKNSVLQEENNRINEKLKQQNAKIKHLENKLKEFEDAHNCVVASPALITSAKIVEISKKLREKCAELESIKTKYSRLEAHFNELKQNSDDEFATNKENPENQELKKELKILQDKLSSYTNKLTEVRNLNSQLKNDLKTANEYLEKETGTNLTSLQQNLSWKGKSQIISELQEKIKELKDKLKNMQEINQTKIRNNTKIQELNKENCDLKFQIEDIKRKRDASKSRNRILEEEIKQIRTKITILNEHYDKDQNLITMLTAQISSTEEVKKNLLREKGMAINKLKLEIDRLKSQVDQYKTIVKASNEQLSKRTKVKETKESKNQEFSVEPKNAKVGQLEAERIKLLDILEIQNKRLQEERDANSKLQNILRMEKQKSAKLEAALARNEVELQETNSYSTLTCLRSQRSMEVSLKDQLELAEESIKALVTRLEMEQAERKMDLKEFSKILQNYKFDVINSDNNAEN